jgi:GNAT superfamily N-acetyltransferase
MADLDWHISATDAPLPADLAAIERGLAVHRQPLAILAREANGTLVGGLSAVTGSGWLQVRQIWGGEPQRRRGLGRQLLGRAEATAIDRGCSGVWLGTFSADAQGFFRACGYQVFGTLPNDDVRRGRFFLCKLLRAP